MVVLTILQFVKVCTYDGTIDIDEDWWTRSILDYNWRCRNTVGSAQTDTNRGGSGGAAHHLANIVNGDNNVVNHTQMGRARTRWICRNTR